MLAPVLFLLESIKDEAVLQERSTEQKYTSG